MRPCINEESNQGKRQRRDNNKKNIKTTKQAYFGAGRIQLIMLNVNLRFNSNEFRENSGDEL